MVYAGRYRKIHIRMWGDAKFQALSRPKPNGQTLWVYLLTGEHTGPIPGVSRVGEAAIAEVLGWSMEGFREAFREVLGQGLAKADWKARLVFIPNAIFYNPPESPNVIKSWGTAFAELPDCELKSQVFAHLSSLVASLSEAFQKAFREAFGKAFANHEHEHEHEQEEEGSAHLNGAAPGGAQPSLSLEVQTQEQEEKITPEDLVAGWNDICVPQGLSKIVTMEKDRRRNALARIAESYKHARAYGESVEDFWGHVFTNISQSAWCRGLRPNPAHPNWKADFDFVVEKSIRPLRAREGKYV